MIKKKKNQSKNWREGELYKGGRKIREGGDYGFSECILYVYEIVKEKIQ